MKQRFSSLDLASSINEFAPKITDSRLQNIYDISPRCFLFKFCKSSSKEFLIIDSGSRIHLTKYHCDRAETPNNFCLKLRKHLRARKLVSVKQLGIDRIVDFEFSSSIAGSYHLIVEFYSAGNILLTDSEYKIISLLRVVPIAEGNESLSSKWGSMAIGENYRWQIAQQLNQFSFEEFSLQIAQKSKELSARKALLSVIGLGPAVVDHLISVAFPPSSNCTSLMQPKKLLSTDEAQQKVFTAYCGFIEAFFAFSSNAVAVSTLGKDAETFEEFHPFPFAHLSQSCCKNFSSFNEAVDEFFHQIDCKKAEQKAIEITNLVARKLHAVKEEQQHRMQQLEELQTKLQLEATLLQEFYPQVEQALGIIKSAHDSHMEWARFEFFLSQEQQLGNEIALLVSVVNFSKQTAVLALEGQAVEVNFLQSIHANIQQKYAARRVAGEKLQRTRKANEKAIRSAEEKIRAENAEAKVALNVTKIRKALWFEKFNWFISTENYLVLGGKDAQQNEMLVRKHMSSKDVYLHADIRGASSIVLIKNPTGEPVPPSTLSQAGCMAICLSKAWEDKIVTSAWWTFASQVTKTASLIDGSYFVTGKKNYLPPSQLIYGIGVLFKLAPESIEAHLGERAKNVEQNAETLEEISKKYEKMNVAAEQEFPETSLSHILAVGSTGKTAEAKQPVRTKAKEKEKTKTPEKQSQKPTSAKKQPSTKEKKLKNKYRDQDEEEKAIRMKLLGHKNPKTNENELKEPSKKIRSNSQEQFVTHSEAQKLSDEIDLMHSEPQDEFSLEMQNLSKEEQEQVKLLLQEEETINQEEQNDNELVQILNSFTGNPLPSDTLLFAIPVCAPYSTLKNYKYKVKLTPGTLKKGKAAKLAISSFLALPAAGAPEEKNFIKAITDQECIQCVLGKSKVSAPSIEKVKRKQ